MVGCSDGKELGATGATLGSIGSKKIGAVGVNALGAMGEAKYAGDASEGLVLGTLVTGGWVGDLDGDCVGPITTVSTSADTPMNSFPDASTWSWPACTVSARTVSLSCKCRPRRFVFFKIN